MNVDKGFSLVEVLAGLVVITLILVSAAQVLIQSNKTAEINKNQLVVIHLADAMLERLKIENQIVKNAVPETETWDTCINIPLVNGTEDTSTITINDQIYKITACLTPRTANDPIVQQKLNLVNVLVQVKDETGKRKSEIEGYIPI